MVDTGVLFIGGVGAAAWAAAGWQAARQWKATTGHRVTGMVSQVNVAPRGGSSSTVRFMDESGAPCRIEAHFRGVVGEEVRVGYPVGKPQHARRIGGILPWGFPIMATVVGGAFLAVATALLTGGLPRLLTGQ